MIEYATETNLYNLLPYMKSACPQYYFMLVWHNDGRYGFHVDPKDNLTDKRGKFRHFELLVKNDFEFEINRSIELNTRVNVEKFNKIFRLGMIALCDYRYREALNFYLYQKQKTNNLI